MKRLLAVKASAGSGKTFRLANRYIALLSVDNPSNILAITFTNKASNEMKERIIKFLKNLGEDKNAIKMICEELGVDEKEILSRKEELLKKFLTKDLNIQTIDAFINKILRKFSYFAGVRNNFEIKDEDKEMLFKRFLYALSDEEMNELIDVAKKEEKFYSLGELFESLYEKDKELKNVTLNSVKKPDDKKAQEAFKKLKEYILNSTESSASAKKAVDIDFYEVPYTTWFVKNSLKEYSYFKKKKLYQEWFEEVLNDLKVFFKEYFEYVEYKFFKNLFYFYDKYKEVKWKFKKDENILGFKDIEHLVYELLKENPIDREFLYFRLDSKINHILIDEFQDTSITQWEIFNPLVDEIAGGIGRKDFRSFFYVGDVKQAIYRFRGGQKELFDLVAKRYAPFGLETEELNVNYRSAKKIVEFVNEKFNLNERPHSSIQGYVEVDEITKESAFETIYEKIVFLNSKGVKDKDIAVLVFKNDDILEVGEFLQQKGKKVVTAKKAKVLSANSVKAIVSLMKYLQNNENKIGKLNFLSLIGKKWGEEIDIKIDRPVKMIKEIMDKYDLYDEASLKLLYHSQKYDTLFDFVNEIDSYSEEMPLKEFDGITVMTIHKSKGLEFDNVIVVDRLSKENNDKGNILFYYEDAVLKDLKLKIPNRELIDEYYAKIKKKEKSLIFEDKKNTEYVAFTRAKNGLIILKRSEVRKDGSSYSAFVSDLEKQCEGEVVKSEDKNSDTPKKRVKIKLKNFGKQEVNVKEEEYKANDFEAIYFGNALHYAFECNDLEAVKNRYGDFCDINEIKQVYEKAIKILPKGKKEIPFIFESQVGRIDLITDEEIIDYKSKKPKDESAYVNQVRGYIKAVEAISGKKLKGKIFYADICKFKEV